MIRRFTSSPNPAVRVRGVHGGRVLAVDAQAVADAVVAGQIGGCLGRGDQVVGGEAEGELGHRDLLDLGAGISQCVGRLLHTCRDIGRAAVDQVPAQPDPHALSAGVQRRPHRLGCRRQ